MDEHDINMNEITLDEITDQVDAATKEEINNNDDINAIMFDECKLRWYLLVSSFLYVPSRWSLYLGKSGWVPKGLWSLSWSLGSKRDFEGTYPSVSRGWLSGNGRWNLLEHKWWDGLKCAPVAWTKTN